MIQGLNLSKFDVNTPKVDTDLMSIDVELDQADFANELEASMAAEEEMVEQDLDLNNLEQEVDAKIVESLINPDSFEDVVKPEDLINKDKSFLKVFDQKMTKQVDQIFAASPEDVKKDTIAANQVNLEGKDIAKNADINSIIKNHEIKVQDQVDSKASSLKSMFKGERAPAVELSPKEIDPNLLNLKDYIEHKKIQAPKWQAQQTYFKETNLQSKMIDPKLVSSVEGKSVPSQDFIFNLINDPMKNDANQTLNQAAPIKMSDLNLTDRSKLIEQVSNYIVKNNLDTGSEVRVTMDHELLGKVDILVSKDEIMGLTNINQKNNTGLNVQLVTQSSEAKAILQQFKNEIIQTLQSSGLTVSDFKIDQSSPGQSQSSDQRGFENKNQSFAGSDKQFSSEQNQKKDESDKRQELWKLLQEREVA